MNGISVKKHASVNFKEGVSGTGDAMGGKPVVLNTRPAARPLGDKTPFPNRARKASTGQDMDMQKGELQQKLPKLLESLYPSLSSRGETLDLSPRPSSTRKSARTPSSANRKFQTPLVNGNPWDVSEGSIELGDVQLQDAQQDAEVEDLDEIEYMPPNTLGTFSLFLVYILKLILLQTCHTSRLLISNFQIMNKLGNRCGPSFTHVPWMTPRRPNMNRIYRISSPTGIFYRRSRIFQKTLTTLSIAPKPRPLERSQPRPMLLGQRVEAKPRGIS